MPSNAGYQVAAYVAATLIYLAYGASVVLRTRALRARLDAPPRDPDTR